MTVAHKDLTGTDLHEIKGADTATIGQIPIANGAGGATFGKLAASSMGPTANPFGASLLHIREERVAGVPSNTAGIAGVWNTVALTTVKTSEISGANLVGNQVTLPAGTYFVEAQSPVYLSSIGGAYVGAQARLQNTSAGTTILLGPGVGTFFSTGVGTVQTQLMVNVRGRFTLASPTNVIFQVYSSSTADVGGRPVGFQLEVYGDVMFWKVA